MKKTMVLLTTFITLCIISPAYSLLLYEGDSATFSFDFSSDSFQPPYNWIEIMVYGTLDGEVQFKGFDTAGPWSSFPYDLEIMGTRGGFLGGGGALREPDIEDTLQYLTTSVSAGSIDIAKIELAMGVTSTIGVRTTQLQTGVLTTAPVPEPASILLLGTGCVVFGGYLRRKLKK